jgi:hypothetical protein
MLANLQKSHAESTTLFTFFTHADPQGRSITVYLTHTRAYPALLVRTPVCKKKMSLMFPFLLALS